MRGREREGEKEERILKREGGEEKRAKRKEKREEMRRERARGSHFGSRP